MRLFLRLAVAAALACPLACGCTATPLPEPPAKTIDFDRITWPAIQPETNIIDIYGDPGAGPPGYTLRVTNLEDQEPFVDVEIADDGSFSVSLPGFLLDELRFHTRLGRDRSAPQDYVWGGGVSDQQRIGCLQLFPLLQQDFGFMAVGGGPAVHTVTLHNGCSDTVQVTAARMRRGSLGYDIGAGAPALPLDVAAGNNASWTLEFAPTSAGDAEEIFFLEVTHGADTGRYPITLFGDGT